MSTAAPDPDPGGVGRRVSTNDVDPRHKLAYWADLVCAHLVKAQCDAPGRARDFKGHILQHEVAGMSLSHIRASAQTVVRTPSLVAQTHEEQILVNIQRTGCSVIRQSGREAFLREGDVAIYASSRPYELAFAADFAQTVLIVPASAMRALMPGVDDVMVSTLSADRMSTGLLLRTADAIQSPGATESAPALNMAATGLLKMLALGVNQGKSPRAQTFDPGQALDALDDGVLVLNRSAQVVYGNSRARALLASSTGMWLSGRHLELQGCTQRMLVSLLGRVLNTAASESLSVWDEQGQLLHALTFRPFPPVGADGETDAGKLGLDEADHVLVMFATPGRQRQPSPRQLIQWFTLTPAEARLARALLGGQTLEAYQMDQGVKLSTLRTQLRSVLRKTGAERQQDLMRLLAQLPAAR